MPTTGQALDPKQWKVVGEVDPQTFQPIAKPIVQQQQQKPQQQQQGTGSFDINQWAAESAAAQMDAASKHGMVTMADYEKARQESFKAATETQRQVQMEQLRLKNEIAKGVAMKSWEETHIKPMNDAQLDKAAGIAGSQDVILNLARMHTDALKNGIYGKWVVGGVAKNFFDATDRNVRAYEAARTGASTQIAKGVFGEASTQASEQSTRQMLKDMMPNEGDDQASGSVKITSLLQNTLNNQAEHIRNLKAGHYDTTSLENAYSRAYNQYKPLVTQYGTDAQLDHPAPSPDELWGGGKAQQTVEQGGMPVSLRPPTVKAGTSASTTDLLVSGATPGYLQSRVPDLGSDEVWNKMAQIDPSRLQGPMVGQTPDLGAPSAWLPATPGQGAEVGTAEQQQQREQKAAGTGERLRSFGQAESGVESAVGQKLLGLTVGDPAKAVAPAINWLGSLLPENWSKNSFDQNQ